MAKVTVDSEIFAVVAHKLIVALSDFATGFDIIATELETGLNSRSEVARQVRTLADYATSMAKELSL